ncbi:MAG: hypothetical protein LVQ75_02135 [Candidatus Babeliales bacterium]|jgi:CRISPR/Cas system CSM-associated protein Csm2 small subunit
MATATKEDLSNSWNLGAFIAAEVKRRVRAEETLQKVFAEAQKKLTQKNNNLFFKFVKKRLLQQGLFFIAFTFFVINYTCIKLYL